MSLWYVQNGFSKDRSDKDVMVVDSRRARSDYYDSESDVYDPGRTRQSFAKDADINNVMRRYSKTGILGDPSAVKRNLFFGDFSEVGSFQEHVDMVNDANGRFALLPAEIRSRFGNDPAQLIAFCNDEGNYDEAVSLGLLPKPPVSLDVVGEEPAPELAPEPAPANEPEGE